MKMKFTIGLLFFLMVALFYSCDNFQDRKNTGSISTVLTGKTQGTTYYIKFLDVKMNGASDSVQNILAEIDRCFSLWRDDSELVMMNNLNDGIYIIQDPANYLREVFDYSKEIHAYTNGAFNPALHPLISSWGFSRKKGVELDPHQVDSLLSLTNFEDWNYSKLPKNNKGGKVKTGNGSLDFNAIAQGYTVDVIGRFFKKNGIENFFIEVGGETLTSGKKHGDFKWVVAIDKPISNLQERGTQDTVYVSDKALVTSGSYRKFIEIDGKKFSHTISPETGYPARNQLLSVSVIMDDCAAADAYATAFMVMGKEKTISFLEEYKFIDGVYLIYEEESELKTYVSEGFKAYLKP